MYFIIKIGFRSNCAANEWSVNFLISGPPYGIDILFFAGGVKFYELFNPKEKRNNAIMDSLN